MLGKRIGYIRVSSDDQNPERQLEGIELDKVFIDKISGKNLERPGLQGLLSYIREHDMLIVHSMDRLARNLDDLRKLVRELTAQHIQIHFIKENLIFAGDDSPMANLLLSVMGAFAEFERALIRERQLEGIALAKKRGAYKGRKLVLNSAQIAELKERVNNGEPKSQIARRLGIRRETVYDYLKKTSV
jgi:DNA invertase Pin-like site-specific DNA recombinase